jgi:hypothetical protein
MQHFEYDRSREASARVVGVTAHRLDQRYAEVDLWAWIRFPLPLTQS